MTREVVNGEVGAGQDISGRKRDWCDCAAWYERREAIVSIRLEFLHLLRDVLRDHAELDADALDDWYRRGRGSHTRGLSIACGGLREELLVWVDREYASAEQELAQLQQA